MKAGIKPSGGRAIDRENVLSVLLEESGRSLYAALYRLTLREDVAQDLMQDLFLKLRRSRGLTSAERPERYAMRAAINLAMDWRRRERRVARKSGAGEEGGSAGAVSGAGAGLVRAEEVARVLDAAAGLRGLMREAFVMRYVHGLGFGAIGEALGRSEHQARALCSKAVTRVAAVVGVERADLEEGGRPCRV